LAALDTDEADTGTGGDQRPRVASATLVHVHPTTTPSTTRQGTRCASRRNHASERARHCRSHVRASPQVRPVELRPHVGGSRFLEVDPIEGGCANDYVYVAGDPVNASDLSGLAACKNFRANSKAGHATLTIKLLSSRTVNGRKVNKYRIDYTPHQGYERRMTRGTVKLMSINPQSSKGKYGTIGQADTNNHAYPGGITGVHTNFEAFAGNVVDITSRIDWQKGTVNAGRFGPLSWSTPSTSWSGSCTA
jgi:hypothetical protein